ncbi:MAG: class I tRNA ligase family protein, partial [Candidatus Heimdallarchaeota archaeon]
KDKRFKKYLGKKAVIPMFGRTIPIIGDEEVDMEFGTGAVMNCTFGDEQDIKWQQRHSLPIKNIVSPDGKIVDTGFQYDGMLLKDAQREISIALKEKGFITKQERIKHRVLCHTERGDCETPMEFLTTKQYMIKLKEYAPELIKAAKRMKWYPSLYLRRATDWIGALEWDWIISRQRLFGTPMPFWSCSDCNEVIAPSPDMELPIDTSITAPPVTNCPKCGSKNIEGTTDVCDCWVDSSLTPLTITKYYEDPEFAKRWISNKSNDIIRLQGHDIIRTWYTYTTFRTLKLTGGKMPYGSVLINGHVLGPDSMKMSKSKGNVVDPRDGIEKYGADAIRQTILGKKVGYDFPFQWDKAQYGKSFLQKLWSVSRYLSIYIDDVPDGKSNYSPIDIWLLSELEKTRKEITATLDKYEFHTSLQLIHEFTWRKLCDNYLESVKSFFRTDDVVRSATVKRILRDTLWTVLRLLAPFCPHITEEIYLKMFKDKIGEISIHATSWPERDRRKLDPEKAELGGLLIDLIAQIRQCKATKRIALNQPVKSATVTVPTDKIEQVKEFEHLVKLPVHVGKIIISAGDEITAKIEE